VRSERIRGREKPKRHGKRNDEGDIEIIVGGQWPAADGEGEQENAQKRIGDVPRHGNNQTDFPRKGKKRTAEVRKPHRAKTKAKRAK